MGRHAQGWKLEPRGKRRIQYVRFTHAKYQHLISTGKTDIGEAGKEAARIYARVVAGGAARPASTRAFVRRSLTELYAEWLSTLEGTLDVETIKTYETTYCGKHWLAHYGSIEDMVSEVARERYRTARLRAATKQTVQKETWVQDKFLRWCKKHGVIGAVPPALEWEQSTLGTRTGPQRERPRELDEAQVRAFIDALPAWREVGKRARLKKPFPVRDRYLFAYEAGLRPATVDALLWRDWDGASTLLIRREADKVRYGREVPLSVPAKNALGRVRFEARERGLPAGPTDPIFGKHRSGKTIAKAAKAVGLDGVAPYDLRHARATHMADSGAALTGIGYLVGHKQATTTNRYLHGSQKAAEEALSRSSREPTQNGASETGWPTGIGPATTGATRQSSDCSYGNLPDDAGAADGTKPANAAGIQVSDLESDGTTTRLKGPLPHDCPRPEPCGYCELHEWAAATSVRAVDVQQTRPRGASDAARDAGTTALAGGASASEPAPTSGDQPPMGTLTSLAAGHASNTIAEGAGSPEEPPFSPGRYVIHVDPNEGLISAPSHVLVPSLLGACREALASIYGGRVPEVP